MYYPKPTQRCITSYDLLEMVKSPNEYNVDINILKSDCRRCTTPQSKKLENNKKAQNRLDITREDSALHLNDT